MLRYEERPLVTFALLTYNQEQYVREAVEGALSQTYSPLQVILSDDCSSDRTFEILEQHTLNYRGPHQIVLNRNPENFGIGKHINRIMDIAKGELIVIGAGDDVSLAERTERLVSVWLASEKTAMSVHSAAFKIDQTGGNLGVLQNANLRALDSVRSIVESNPPVIGATHAWAKKVFDVFGPLDPRVVHEDRVIPLRSAMLGKIVYVAEPLVKYRVNVGVSSDYGSLNWGKELFGRGAQIAYLFYIDYFQKVTDLKLYFGDNELVALAQKKLNEKWLIKALASRESSPILLWKEALDKGVSLWFSARQIIKYVFPAIYIAKIAFSSRLRS